MVEKQWGQHFFLSDTGAAQPDARLVGGWFFSAAISGINPATGELPADPDQQTEQLFANLKNLLDQAGISTDAIGHMMVWQKDRRFREPLNKLWERWFPDRNNRPARHVVVRDWDDDALIKVELTAIAGERRKTIVDMPGASLGGGANRGFIPLAAVVGDVLFTGAMAGWNLSTGIEAEDPQAQVGFIFSNMEVLLKRAGFTMDDIGHAFVWLSDHGHRQLVNDNWQKYYPQRENRPARHAVKVDLPLDLAAQLEIIAVRGCQRSDVVEMPAVSHGAEREPGFLPVSSTLGNVLFTSATPGTCGDDHQLPTNPAEEIRALFENVRDNLKATGFDPRQVGHVYLWKTGNQWDDIIARQWSLLWPEAGLAPVRHDVLAELPGGMRVQIELIAVKEAL